MSFLADLTFFDVSMSLLAVALIERLMYLLPESMVGPRGWLLVTNIDQGAAE